jgi:hypothetical protein
MKITKEQLKKVIKEEVENLEKEDEKNFEKNLNTLYPHGKPKSVEKYLKKGEVKPSMDKKQKIREAITKVLEESGDLLKQLQEEPQEHLVDPITGKSKEEDYSESGLSGVGQLEEEKIEHRYNAEEDHSEDPHKTSFEQLDEVAPPGKEKVVRALKKELPKTYKDKSTGWEKESNPWAVAWSQYKKDK